MPTPNPPDTGARRLGSLLVALQFGLIALLLLLNVPVLRASAVPAGAVALAAVGIGIGLWALWANPPGNFNIRPIPREGGRLIEDGPYRWLRHPMYTSVLVCGAAAAWSAASLWAWLALAALCAVLLAKANLEERWMAHVHPAYAAYRARTWRVLPGLF